MTVTIIRAITAVVASGGGGGSGTVTNIAVSAKNGIVVSGSPITSAGTFTFSLGNATNTYSMGITVDGAGSAITTGSKGYTQVNYNCNITKWTILADVSGTASMDIKRSTYVGFPTTTSLIGTGNAPILSGDRKQTAAPSGWTSTIISAGDVIEYVVSAATIVTRMNLIIQLLKI